MVNEFDHLDIYQEIEGDFLLFLPKNHPALEELDLRPEKFKKIEKITEIYRGPLCRPSIENFIDLFSSTKNARKRVVLSGHGNDGYIGALTTDNYTKFLKFLENSCCEFLEIISCYGGGMNTLTHYLEAEEKITPSFAIKIDSIGSFPTRSWMDPETFKKTFQTIEQFFSKRFSDLIEFRKQVKNQGIGLRPLLVENNPFVCFENHSLLRFPLKGRNLPQGFRPVREERGYIALTYPKLQAAKLNIEQFDYEEKQIKHASTPAAIQVEDANIFEIFPLIVDVPLTFNQTPFLLSMVPGNCHHLLQQVTLHSKKMLTDFFSEYQNCNDIKAFFIKDLEVAGKKYHQVAMIASSNGVSWVQREDAVDGDGEKHPVYYLYQNSSSDKREISAEEHAFIVHQWAEKTTPLSEAVRVSSGGQETDQDFSESLRRTFWDENFPLPKDYKIYLDLCNKEEEPYEETLKNVAVENLQFILEAALDANNTKLALFIINHYSKNIDLDKKGLFGEILINQAIKNKSLPLVKLLVENGVNLNGKGFVQLPLNTAIIIGDPEIIDYFLTILDKFDIEAKDKYGKTAFWLAAARSRPQDSFLIPKTLSEKGADINAQNSWGSTALNCAVYNKEKRTIDELLKIGADPYAGKPSALIYAIHNRDLDMVSYLIEKGVNASLADHEGNYPIIEAASKGTPAILREILKNKNVNINVENNKKETAILKAYKNGSLANFEILKSMGASINVAQKPGNDLLSVALELHDTDFLELFPAAVIPRKETFFLELFPGAVISQKETLNKFFEEGIKRKDLKFCRELLRLRALSLSRKCLELSENYRRNNG